MTRENIMEAVNGIGDHLIAEAAEKLGFLNGSAAVIKGERRKGSSAFSRFINSGWGVAAVCALVAVSVMGGIIWAGNQPGHQPPVDTHEETTAPPEIESEAVDYIGDDQTEVSLNSGGQVIYPREFFVWSGPGDGLGFYGTVDAPQVEPILPTVYFVKDESERAFELRLENRALLLRRAQAFDAEMQEVADEQSISEGWSCREFVQTLPVGRYHICLYIEYTEDGEAVSGSDYAFTVTVVETAEDIKGVEETVAETEAETNVLAGDDFEPGVILLGLKEPYTGDLNELFPELGIAEVEDINLTWYEQLKDSPDKEEQLESFKNKIGTEFIIILTDTTKEAVLAGIASIESNPIVAYASPNHVVYLA